MNFNFVQITFLSHIYVRSAQCKLRTAQEKLKSFHQMGHMMKKTNKNTNEFSFSNPVTTLGCTAKTLVKIFEMGDV